MSNFKFEEIKNEVYLKFSEHSDDKNLMNVTPLSCSLDFPLEFNENRNCALPYRYCEYAERIRKLEIKSDDVWVISYPKSGTTWMQEMVWLLKNNFDYRKALEIPNHERFPFLEMSGMWELPGNKDTMESVEEFPSPRLVKSHLPVQLLPEGIWSVKPKTIYIKRNVKDVAVSYFHHSVYLHGFLGNMESFIDAFLAESVLYSPYYPHVVDYCRAAEKLDNLLILNYEDLKMDLKGSIQKVANFLEVKIDDENLNTLADHLGFDKMRNNKSVNLEEWVKINLQQVNRFNENDENTHFIRKGKVGGWREELSSELVEKIDKWIELNVEQIPDAKKYCQHY